MQSDATDDPQPKSDSAPKAPPRMQAPPPDFHHAKPGYVMMTRWLPDCPSPLPHNASSQVGVGAVVVNDEGKVLLVQEAVGPLRGRNIWKIPTGLLDAREDICDGVVRPRCFSFCVTQPCR